MGQELNDLVVAVVRPPLIVLRFVVEKTYALFFGWWLDKRVVKRENERFEDDIRKELYFLFASYGARIVPNEQEPPALFDFASVTISTNHVILYFHRGRGDVTVNVAAVRAPREAHELSALLSVMEVGVERQVFSRLDDIAQVLRSHMNDIERAFSSDCYPKVKERLSNVYAYDRTMTRQWETEINRRLYPDK